MRKLLPAVLGMAVLFCIGCGDGAGHDSGRAGNAGEEKDCKT